MTEALDTSFISKQVQRGDYYFLNLTPAADVPLAVMCGGREICGAGYRIHRREFLYHSIEFVAAGTGQVTLAGSKYSLQPGVLFRYGPGIAHLITADAGSSLDKYFVDFTGTACTRLMRTPRWTELQPLHVAVPARVQAIYDELLRVGVRQTPHARQICALLLEQLILLVSDEAVPSGEHNSPAWEVYRKCRDHIDAHYLKLSTLSEVAAACHVSDAHVCRVFRRFGAPPPYQTIVRLKMARAASLLLDHELLVKQVAQKVGFDDQYHFSKTFKRVYGLSPDSFRTRGSRRAVARGEPAG